MKMEIRTFELTDIKTRDATDVEPLRVTGYASVFNSPTLIWEDLEETILPGAFSRALAENSDIRCLFNHDWSVVLGRTKSGTLRLEEDDRGLKFEVQLPNTTAARDLAESMGRGDITQCSFGFVPTKVAMDYDSSPMLRTIEEVELWEVSIVALPAYEDTEASLVRSKTISKDTEERIKILNKIKGALTL
ncbi:HK97 family phage prohead protease [Listeria booriae]|uniref:HK97 family phage prohead protease n=1 Tax=Listeria booriae TaxID=1552123 RepID=UPI00164D03AE|nr:HK97 family phage prohead protease [Listeria booriae]MBC6300309.1 HK97 family phage prohead protease [Listeria booriae]